MGLIRPVQALASRVTKWNHLCDRKLRHVISSVNSTLGLNLPAGGYYIAIPDDVTLAMLLRASNDGELSRSVRCHMEEGNDVAALGVIKRVIRRDRTRRVARGMADGLNPSSSDGRRR